MRNFHNDIERIREIPIEIDQWARKQVGKRNEGPFKDNFQFLRIGQNKEPLVDISKFNLFGEDYYLKLAGSKNFLAKKLSIGKIFLRMNHVKRLVRADKYLRKRGLFICIVSGWRHPELQRTIKNNYAKKFGQKRADRLFASIDKKTPAPHTTGASFDIELRELYSRKKIEMNLSFGNENINSLCWAEDLLKNKKLNPKDVEAVKNRRILYHILCSKGIVFKKSKDLFTAHPGEYWHYGDGDTLSTYLNKKKTIKYGITFPM